jgi:flagellar biosynthesis/type III secretory pathway protein FliH
MNRLIKASDLDSRAVRPVGVAALPQEDEVSILRRRIVSLQADIGEREGTIAKLRENLNAQKEEVYEAGRALGLKQAEDTSAERLAQLERALQRSTTDIRERLASTERLAALLARECLDRMFAETEDRAGIVCDLIERQVRDIEAASILLVEVSSQDFAQGADLDKIVARIGHPDVRIDARADLPSGSCLFSLRLGQVDLGLDQQWGALRTILEDASQPDAQP